MKGCFFPGADLADLRSFAHREPVRYFQPHRHLCTIPLLLTESFPTFLTLLRCHAWWLGLETLLGAEEGMCACTSFWNMVFIRNRSA